MTPAASSPWLGAQERSNMLALRVMTWIALVGGRRVARVVLHAIALYFLLFAPTPRRHSARYLGRALGRPARWRDLYRHVHSFASTVLDRVYLLRGQMARFDVQVHGEPVIAATLEAGRGAFLLGAHLGSVEVMRAVGQDRAGLRIAMVMYPDNARLINAALAAIAPDVQAHIIALGRSGSTLAMRDWLDGGGLAGMLGDRSLPSASERAGTLSVPFLGRDASFGDGPFRLAMLLRRRVIFMAGLYRGGARYDVHFETLADFSQPPDGAAERERAIRDAVHAYVQRLESLCREAPYNWFNFYDFWREDAA
jgi:predicted LPLAT superfamily acyltransferase